MSARARIGAALLLAMVGASSCTASAAAPPARAPDHGRAAPGRAKPPHMVSGLLRKSTGDGSLLLVHAMHPADSVDEATGAFVRHTLADYPGYTIAATMASPANLPAPACPARGALDRPAAEWPRVEAPTDAAIARAAE
jgi:hypothetical protein